MDSTIKVWLLMSVFWIPGTLSQRELASCNPNIDCDMLPIKTYSDIHGNYLPVNLAKVLLKENQTAGDCRFNFTEVLLTCYPEPPAALSHMVLGLKCRKRRYLVFEKLNLPDYNKVLLQVQVHNCKLCLDDIDMLGKVTDFRVLSAFDTAVLPSTLAGDANHNYTGLEKIVSMTVLNSNSTNRLETFFPRPDVFKSMAEVVFHNMSIDKLPADFQSRMPTLQSLDLIDNKLTSPPNFPWYSDYVRLPLNLTRTKVFNSQYTTLQGIRLDGNLFRRVFHLGRNRLVTLRGYNFTGRIQILTLPGNGLREFGEEVLAQVTGLEQLDLSMNNLTFVSPRALNHPGLLGLTGLNLRENQIESLNNATFEILTKLTKVDLANNKLSVLKKGTFSRLLKLEVLHLEHNQLDYIMSGCFPEDRNVLKHVYLSNNRFKQIPADLFSLGSFNLIDLSSCRITFDQLNETLSQVPISKLQKISPRSRSLPLQRVNIFKRVHLYQKVINLQDNNISDIPVYSNLPQFKLLFVYYKLLLENNPISCLGLMSDFIAYINREVKKGNFDRTEYMFQDIKCSRPFEFADKPVLSLDPTTMFYPSTPKKCPSQCVCYKFVSRDEYMVNCSYSRLRSFPCDLPPGTVDLRLQYNNITILRTAHKFPKLRKLDISYNQISRIDDDFFSMTPGLKRFSMNHNLLRTIPQSIRTLRLVELNIVDNHFQCDCKMTWVKSWLIDNKAHVINWDKLICTYGSNNQSAIVKVNEKDFICSNAYDWRLYMAVALSVVSLVVLTGAILLYRFRFDIKALLFVRFNVKIFEKKEVLTLDTPLDTAVVCSRQDYEWTHENIYKTLKASSTIGSVALCDKDFLVGLTRDENFDLMVDFASKITVVVTEDFFADALCVSSLEKAVRLSLRKRTKSVVIVELKPYFSSSVKSACVRRFLRTQNRFKPADKLFREKLIYSVSTKYPNVKLQTEDTQNTAWETVLYSRLPATTRPCTFDLYVACSDNDLMWVRDHVSSNLEEQGIVTCIPARDFIPGVPIDTQIVENLGSSRKVLLVLSNNYTDNFLSFVLRLASQTSLSEHSHYFIVMLLKGTVVERLGQEEQAYINTHTCLHQDDSRWWEKLMRSVTTKKQIDSGADGTTRHINVEQVSVRMNTDAKLCPGADN